MPRVARKAASARKTLIHAKMARAHCFDFYSAVIIGPHSAKEIQRKAHKSPRTRAVTPGVEAETAVDTIPSNKRTDILPGEVNGVNSSFLFPYPGRRAGLAVLSFMAISGLAGTGISLHAQTPQAETAHMHASRDAMPGRAHMAGHMYLTTLRPPQAGDRQKADAVAAAAKEAMAP